MKVSTKKHRATIFKCILSSRKTFGEMVPKILLNAPLCSMVTSCHYASSNQLDTGQALPTPPLILPFFLSPLSPQRGPSPTPLLSFPLSPVEILLNLDTSVLLKGFI